MSIPGNANPLLLATAADGAAAAAGPTKSLRFNSGDTSYLTRTPSSAGNRRTWTWSGWVKRSRFANEGGIFSTYSGSHPSTAFFFLNEDTFRFQEFESGSFNLKLDSNRVFRDPSAWYHFVVALDTTQSTASNRVKIYVNGVLLTSSDYSTATYPDQNHQTDWNNTTTQDIGRHDLILDGYIADVYFIDGSQLDCTSFGAFDSNGVWQAAAYSGTFGTNGFHLLDFASESTVGHDSSGNENDFTANNITSSLSSGNTGPWTSGFRDGASPGGNWGSASATTISSGDSWSTNGNNDELHIDTGSIGSTYSLVMTKTGGASNMDVFTSSTGSSGWTRVTNSSASITISSGTSSHTFSRYVRIGGSGDGNVTFSITGTAFGDAASDLDILFDVPTNGTQSDTGAGGEVSGNYACFNSLDTPWTLSNGNLDATAPGSPNRSYCPATIFVNSGKYYAEFTLTNNSTSTSPQVGVVKQGDAQGYIGNTGTGGVGYEPATDRVINAGTSTVPFYNTAYTSAGVVVGLGLDMDAGTLVGYVNGTSIGTLATGLSGYYAFACGDINGSGVPEVVVNFGQRAFAYGNAGTNRPAATYKALCTTHLPTPTIADGSAYFEAKLYTGNGGTNTITGLEFSPDWTWIKKRNSNSSHSIHDTVRGATKRIRSESSDAETTETTALTAFTSDGFTLGSGGTANANNDSFVSWNWDAGSSTASNTDGSITSSVRANQTAGFSIVGFTATNTNNATVGHGLNAAPELIILKNRDSSEFWWVIHKYMHASPWSDHTLRLNTTDSVTGVYATFNNVAPTSSVINLSNTTSPSPNKGTDDKIMYCFAPVAGYSAFGSYTGNGSSDGPFVHTGFKVAFLLVKRYDTTQNWYIFDATRDTYNPTGLFLNPNLNSQEYDYEQFDFLSNGFKLRGTDNGWNGSGGDYIYYAVAENPFQANGGLAR